MTGGESQGDEAAGRVGDEQHRPIDAELGEGGGDGVRVVIGPVVAVGAW